MASLYGTVGPFNEQEETWTQYVERLEQYFIANDVKDDKKQRAIFLSVCGPKTYALLRDLLQPEKPSETDLKVIVKTLEAHFLPKPNVIVERFKFHSRGRRENESISMYVAELRKMTEHCKFGEILDDMIRDRLVCGVNNDRIQRRLLTEPELTYQKAVDIALALESTAKHVQDLGAKNNIDDRSESSINQVKDERQPQFSGNTEAHYDCYRCGGKHRANSCRFREAKCFNCQKTGHIAKVCRRKSKTGSGSTGSENANKTNLVDAKESEEYTLYQVRETVPDNPVKVGIDIAGTPVTMIIDTGATKTIINEATYKRLGNTLPPLNTTSAVLTTYTGENITVLGEVIVPVRYENQQKQLPVLVVRSHGPNLFGRNWMEVIKLNWDTIFCLNDGNVHSKLKQVLDTHKHVFNDELGTLQGMKAKVHLTEGAQPKFLRARTVPYAMRVPLEQELERLEQEGIISPVQFSEWAAPIVPVVKSDGSVRVCGDYKCTINQASKLDNYPIPKTEDLLTALGGSHKFTKLDMSQAYQQLLLDDESKPYTTINTHKGLYQYNRLPFGVSSAPGIFQRTMENLLNGIPCVIVRIDDILVGGKDDADHLSNLEAVLTRLSAAGLRLKKSKCEFLASKVIYCGYSISGAGIQPVVDKVKAIQEAPEPQNLSQLRAFLGMLNYYHRFLPNIATTLEPLHKLLRQGTPWQWEHEQEKAFERAKELLQSADLLIHFDPSKPLILATDASDYGVGAVLSHQLPDGSEKPIGYASRSLNAAERNYSTIEKETLAIIFGVKKFHQFLYGHAFTINTDHKPLEGLLSATKGIPPFAAPRVQRWALTLAAYEYTIHYKAGRQNDNADALSRLPLPEMPSTVPQPGETVLLMNHLNETPVTSAQIKDWTKRDPVLSQVVRFTLEGWPMLCEREALKPYMRRRLELSVEDGCILWGTRVVIPPLGRSKILAELHEAHPGVSRMKALARSYVWWPSLDTDIEQQVKGCNQCQLHRSAPAAAPLHPWEWPGHPWSRLHIDYAGPYHGDMFLVVIDAYSKWLDVHLMKSTTSTATIEKLREIFATHGLPATVVSDNGTNFSSQEFEEFMKRNGIKHIRVSPYHPASNGQAERAVRVFKEGMEKMKEGTIRTRLSRFLFNYRITPHTTTGVAPAEMLMKRRLRTHLDLVQPKVEEQVMDKQFQQKLAHDQHAKERVFNAGDQVFVRDFRKPKTWLCGTIVKRTGPVSAEIELEDGQTIRRHFDHMRIRATITEDRRTDEADDILPPVREMPLPDPPEVIRPAEEQPPVRRQPPRERRIPQHLNDYELAD